MATRLYLPASTASTPISPTPDAAWEDTSIIGRAMARPSSISNAMATVSFGDSDATDKDILFRQFISQPLVAGQTVTGAQSLKAQCRVAERNNTCNMFLTVGIRILASDGTTVRKTVLAVTRDTTEAATSLTNRQFTATSAATNYTTQAGDRLVIEIGTGGDPNAGSDHDTDLRLGDSAGSDLSEDDSSTTDNRPWVQLNDTLAFVFTATAAVTHGGRTCSGSAQNTVPSFHGTASVTRGHSTAAGSATFVAQPVYTAQAAVVRGHSTCSGSGWTSSPHPVGKITQHRFGLSGRRYGSFAGKPTNPPYSEGAAAVVTGGRTCNGSGITSSPHTVGKITQHRHGLSGKRYGSFASKGATQYTGAAALVRGPTSASGSAQNTVPTSTGTAAVTRGPTTAAGSGTHTTPVFTATTAVVTGGRTVAGAATFTTPVYAGTAAITRGPTTAAGLGTVVNPLYTASAAVTRGHSTASGAGTVVNPSYTATAAITRGGITASGTSLFAAEVYQAFANVSRGHSTAAGAGTFTKPVYLGTATVTRGPTTAAGTGTFTRPVYSGTALVTTGGRAAVGAATFAAAFALGEAIINLGAILGSGLATSESNGEPIFPIVTHTGTWEIPTRTTFWAVPVRTGTWEQ